MMVSARDQALARVMDHGEHILESGVFEEQQARVESPFCVRQIIITAILVYKQLWVGLVCSACMHGR